MIFINKGIKMTKQELRSLIIEELNKVKSKKSLKEARGSGRISKRVKYYSQDVINAVYELEEALAGSNVDFDEIGDIVLDIIDAAAEEATNR